MFSPAKPPPGDGKTVIFMPVTPVPRARKYLKIAELLGYTPVELGQVDEGGRLIQARNALVLRHFIERPMF